ncbi:MAG TPA: surface-adhesin E family protein [Nitrospiraceae bacterium]|jgi:hypothetical protein|nr:surface-adhesin E family protein [Nitrospiraceae bacterium]
MPFSIRPSRRLHVTYKAGLFLKLPLAYFLGFVSLITLLLLSSGPAYAAWELIGESADFGVGVTVYVGPETIRRKGDLVKMWKLYDFKTIQTVAGKSYFSSKARSEFDCAEERLREFAYTWFSGSMGRGIVVLSDSNEGRWEPTAPESIGQMLWNFACGKH